MSRLTWIAAPATLAPLAGRIEHKGHIKYLVRRTAGQLYVYTAGWTRYVGSGPSPERAMQVAEKDWSKSK